MALRRAMKFVVAFFLISFTAKAQQQGSLRLVDGSSPNEGRLEVYLNGQWGTVCGNSWDNNDAVVACRQLGYYGVDNYGSYLYPEGSRYQRILMNEVYCTGSEAKLVDCYYVDTGDSYCTHSQDIGITCTRNSDHLQNGLVRLVGGSKESEGRVEVSYDGQWQQVCYYSFDQEDAEVVCRQLGYNMALYQTSTWFDSSVSDGVDIYCFGGESGLNDCTLSKPSDCYSFLRPFIECSNVYTPLVWTVLVPLVSGLVVLCVLCLPCCVACRLYCRKKGRSSPNTPGEEQAEPTSHSEVGVVVRPSVLSATNPPCNRSHSPVGAHSMADVVGQQTEIQLLDPVRNDQPNEDESELVPDPPHGDEEPLLPY